MLILKRMCHCHLPHQVAIHQHLDYVSSFDQDRMIYLLTLHFSRYYLFTLVPKSSNNHRLNTSKLLELVVDTLEIKVLNSEVLTDCY
jgi:hypothetical protein